MCTHTSRPLRASVVLQLGWEKETWLFESSAVCGWLPYSPRNSLAHTTPDSSLFGEKLWRPLGLKRWKLQLGWNSWSRGREKEKGGDGHFVKEDKSKLGLSRAALRQKLTSPEKARAKDKRYWPWQEVDEKFPEDAERWGRCFQQKPLLFCKPPSVSPNLAKFCWWKLRLMLGRDEQTDYGHLQKLETLPTKVCIAKAMCFFFPPSSHVQLWELDHKESWAPKNWHCQIVVLEKTLESPLGCKEIKPVNPKGNQPWVFIGKTDAKAILWLPDMKSWLIGKDPDAGKDWRQEEKRVTEDEIVGWHHPLNGHEFE